MDFTICILNDQFKRNIQVTCLTRDSSRFLKKYPLFDRLDINFIEGDVRKFTIPNKHFDLVIHAATETSTRTSNNQDIQSVILDGMDHMLDFVKQCGVSRFLFTSSGGVYGEMPQGQKSFSETMLPHPSSLYGKAKLEAECNCLLRSQQEGWIGTIARCFSFVGPYLPLDANFAIGDFVQDVLMNSPIIIQ
ncbi:MAG: NAD-dependent epimerase/dehydratase family protein, partial [Akkermansia sp.]